MSKKNDQTRSHRQLFDDVKVACQQVEKFANKVGTLSGEQKKEMVLVMMKDLANSPSLRSHVEGVVEEVVSAGLEQVSKCC